MVDSANGCQCKHYILHLIKQAQGTWDHTQKAYVYTLLKINLEQK